MWDRRRARGPLRVAIVAGGLGHGGAEKQMLCTVRALRRGGADVRVYSLERDGFYAAALRAAGAEPVWIGRGKNPAARLVSLTRLLRSFRPDVIQAGHSFVNLYVGLAARFLGTIGLGALRSSLVHCRRANGRWTRWLMSAPEAVLVNSETARRELVSSGWVQQARIFVLPNAIDLTEHSAERPGSERTRPAGDCVAILVGRMIASKRVDVFLRALAVVREGGSNVRGMLVGEGPELARLKALAASLGLSGEAAAFLGNRNDVPALLRDADLLVLCSEDEGFPNVILEAGAAGLPVVTTPAGDAAFMVEADKNGTIVPFGDTEALAAELGRLAESPEVRTRLGAAGKSLAARYDLSRLAPRLREIYLLVARLEGRDETLGVVSTL